MSTPQSQVRPFSLDELLDMLVTADDFRERSPAEILASMSDEDRSMCVAIAQALRAFFARRRAISDR